MQFLWRLKAASLRISNMPDITMCLNSCCPLASKCHRSTAIPYEQQSFDYFHYQTVNKKTECDLYIPNYDRPKNRRIAIRE